MPEALFSAHTTLRERMRGGEGKLGCFDFTLRIMLFKILLNLIRLAGASAVRLCIHLHN